LGEGLTLDQILQGMKEVAEGVYTARAARELAAKLSIPRAELPIIHMVADIVDVRYFTESHLFACSLLTLVYDHRAMSLLAMYAPKIIHEN
jgi:glycerol-3-phosphate dehydrogenase